MTMEELSEHVPVTPKPEGWPRAERLPCSPRVVRPELSPELVAPPLEQVE